MRRALPLTVLLACPAAAQICGVPRDLQPSLSSPHVAFAVSPNGQIVAGSVGSGGTQKACIWIAPGGPLVLPTPVGFASRALGTIDDGSVVVGTQLLNSGGLSQPFRWTEPTGSQLLPSLGGGEGTCAAVSADGTIAVGATTFSGSPVFRACLWDATGVHDLGTLGGPYSEALDVSADGSVVVGISTDAGGFTRAFRWTAAGGMQAPVNATYSEAHAVSADGSVMVGFAQVNGMNHAFRWSAAGGTQLLGSTSTLAWGVGVSHDGEVVVGYFEDVTFMLRPFVWTPATGMQPLATPPGENGGANDVSAAGDVVAGWSSSRAWVQHVERPSFGTRLCSPSTPNSTGCWASLGVRGSVSVAANELELVASDLPAHVFGYFLTSRTQTAPQPLAGSQGSLCLGGAIGGFAMPDEIGASGVVGRIALRIDLTALPPGTGVPAAQAGETWSFQAWYRDENPSATSNFTDSVRATLQ